MWGDYGSNAEYDEIYVYGLTVELVVEKIYKFEAGMVRHIHNIVAKRNGDGYYIFTGDQESTAGIYESDNQFHTVMPKKVGEQRYMAVVGFDTKKRLLYVTDAVNEKIMFMFWVRKDKIRWGLCLYIASCLWLFKIWQ